MYSLLTASAVLNEAVLCFELAICSKGLMMAVCFLPVCLSIE